MTTMKADKDLSFEEGSTSDLVVDPSVNHEVGGQGNEKKSFSSYFPYVPRRFIFVALGFLGFFNIYGFFFPLSLLSFYDFPSFLPSIFPFSELKNNKQ